MQTGNVSRRRLIGAAGGLALGMAACGLPRRFVGGQGVLTVYTFGDSILDCRRYYEYGVDPGPRIGRLDGRLLPECRERDLRPRGAARLGHRARDGATVRGLPAQAQGLTVEGPAVALLT